jgi:hypothetical protein
MLVVVMKKAVCAGAYSIALMREGIAEERGGGVVFTSVRSAVCSGDGLRASREMRPCVAEVVEEDVGDDVA